MINGKKIAIDVRMIEASGIGTYIQHLMGAGIYDVAIGNEEVIRKYDKDVTVIPFQSSIYGLKGQLCFPKKEIKKQNVELIHFPHYNVPLFYRGKFVVTIHDLTHLVFPEFLGNRLKYIYAETMIKHSVKKSQHIFTVSEYSKQDIHKFFGIENEKISITYDAVDLDFKTKSKKEIEYLYVKYNIPQNKKILLYVGNLKPHKNLGRLLEAVSQIESKEEYYLILAGKAFQQQELYEQEIKLGIKELVCHTGLIRKEELVDLYNLADLFIFPSLYEGFGIPPLEAMACGTPVIASNASSIPEVVGDAAILFDPMDVEQMRQMIEKFFKENNFKDKMIRLGYDRVGNFSWETTRQVIREKLL